MQWGTKRVLCNISSVGRQTEWKPDAFNPKTHLFSFYFFFLPHRNDEKISTFWREHNATPTASGLRIYGLSSLSSKCKYMIGLRICLRAISIQSTDIRQLSRIFPVDLSRKWTWTTYAACSRREDRKKRGNRFRTWKRVSSVHFNLDS